MSETLHAEWRNSQEQTKYPFSSSSRLFNEAQQIISPDLFLDAVLYPIGNVARLFLSQVTIAFASVEIQISSEDGSILAVGEFDRLDPPSVIRLQDPNGRPAGVLVSEPDRLAQFQTWPVGDHVFGIQDAEFAATVSIPTPEIGLRGVQLEDGTVLADDLWLVGGDGVALSREVYQASTQGQQGAVETYEVIRVDVVGDPLFKRRLCGDQFEDKRYLRQLQFRRDDEVFTCAPDASGDVRMMAGNSLATYTVLRIRPCGGNRLVISAVGQRQDVAASPEDDEADLCR